MCRRMAGLSLLLLVVLLLGSCPVWADDFRVETELFLEKEKEAALATLTIFKGHVVYDFLLGTEPETTVFDVARGRIVLLDPQRKVKTTVTTEKLAEFTAAIQVRGNQKDKPGLFAPKFEVAEDGAQQFTLKSPELTYRVTGQVAKQSDAVERYRTFADWYARLNAIRPPNLPPFGRLELNRHLAERQWLPERIERTANSGRRQTAHSVHLVNWILSSTDENRLAQAARQQAEFAEVSLAQYWNASPNAE